MRYIVEISRQSLHFLFIIISLLFLLTSLLLISPLQLFPHTYLTTLHTFLFLPFVFVFFLFGTINAVAYIDGKLGDPTKEDIAPIARMVLFGGGLLSIILTIWILFL